MMRVYQAAGGQPNMPNMPNMNPNADATPNASASNVDDLD